MIQVDLPMAFVIGQTFSMLSKPYLRKEQDIYTSKLLGPFNLYLSTCFATGGLFLLVGWPAWEFMYKAQWIENVYNNPFIAAFYIAFVIAMILLGNVGYILGHYWYKKGKDTYVVIGLILGVLLTFLPFILNWGVWEHIGTHDEITMGKGYPIFSGEFFKGWIGIICFMLITGLLTGTWFNITSKKLAKKI